MAVYFDHHIEAPENIGSPSEIAWHRIHPLLAVASVSTSCIPGGSVDVYLEQGEHIPSSHIERPFQPIVISWHPSKRVVATGWETGAVIFWSEQGVDEQQIAAGTHRAQITILEWSSNGTRLVSADKAGVLMVWRVDQHGRVQGSPLGKQDYGKQLTQCIFKPPAPGEDLIQLAKAAVSGDENALDMFNWRKVGKGDAPFKVGLQQGITCFVSAIDGTVYYVGEKGKSLQLLSTDRPIRKLMYMEGKEILMVVTEALILSQHSIALDGTSQELMKVKLSGKTGQKADIIWAESGLLITATDEIVIRLWDLDKDENYALTLEEHLGFSTGEIINCISYSESKGIIAAGTRKGQVALWRKTLVNRSNGCRIEGKDQWKLQAPIDLEGNITQIKMLRTDMHVKGVYVTKETVAVWNGKHATVFESFGPSLRNAGSFPCDSSVLAVLEESIYTVEPNRVQVRTLQGTVKQLLVFNETEGNPSHLNICGNFLVVGTDTAHVKVFDLSRSCCLTC